MVLWRVPGGTAMKRFVPQVGHLKRTLLSFTWKIRLCIDHGLLVMKLYKWSGKQTSHFKLGAVTVTIASKYNK